MATETPEVWKLSFELDNALRDKIKDVAYAADPIRPSMASAIRQLINLGHEVFQVQRRREQMSLTVTEETNHDGEPNTH